jgi:hypothetical protein
LRETLIYIGLLQMARERARSTEGSPQRTPIRAQGQFIQRRDFLKLYPGSSPENEIDITMQTRDYVFENWQEKLRKSEGLIFAEPWPKLLENGQGAKKAGPTLEKWPSTTHDKFSTKSHLSSWLWEALNKCALMQYSPSAAMNYILSHVANPQTQQQIRHLLSSLNATMDKNEDIDAFYHCIFVLVSEASPTQHEAYSMLTDMRPKETETVIEYYIRFISMVSLLINARDYGQHNTGISQEQLQQMFAQTLNKADRKIDQGKLSQYMSDPNTVERFHPRENASGYKDLWSLVLVNENLTVPAVSYSSTKPHVSQIHQAIPQPIVAHNLVLDSSPSGVDPLGKGRSTEAPPSYPEGDWKEFIAKEIEKAVSAVAKQQSPQKRARVSSEKRPVSEQAERMDKARDQDQETWPKLPSQLRMKIIKLCGAIKDAKRISDEPHVVEKSTKVVEAQKEVQAYIDSDSDLKNKMPTAKICIGCVGYGHLYKKNKCPLA